MYQSKFPIDPFSRDQSFTQSSILYREMQQTVQGMRGKQFNSGKKNMTINEDCKKFNDLNVIKADYKTHQRQKEIINVIADFSAQISQSMAKAMNSFMSQIDGQKPVATNLEMQ